MFYIKQEDTELEEAVFDGDSCIAVPFEVCVKSDGESFVTVYSRFSSFAERFVSEFYEEPFGDEAIAFIRDSLEKPMLEAGYEFDERLDHMIYRFISDGEVPLFPAEKAEIVKISTNAEFEKYYNDASRDVELDDFDECDICFAAVIDDCIVSFAGVNDISDDGHLEINVETAEAFRGRGYAKAVVSALVNYLISLGEKVSYRCVSSNTASIGVARAVGLFEDSVSYSFVCYGD